MIPAADILQRALESRDARFDGVFFVGVTSTNIYCRPICPARVSYASHRRFFDTAGAAERAGYRPCLRCRPELAPGLAVCDAVSQLARAAALRIAAGALNGGSVSSLARELDVSERHLRRAMERELGVSPIDLAQTHRLLLAKKLLGETALPVTRIAYASGFQSLRRFNSVFRERYALAPSAVRRARTAAGDEVRLSLGYRAPFAWSSLLEALRREAVPGVETVRGAAYSRTVQIDGHSGVIVVRDDSGGGPRGARVPKTQLSVSVSPELLPALMPLLARLRRLFDLDSEPLVVDAHLAMSGLKSLVRRRPGLRAPGAFDGFEAALGTLAGGPARANRANRARLAGVVAALGEPIETGDPAITHIMPTAKQICGAGEARLRALGVDAAAGGAIVQIARETIAGRLVLDPSADEAATLRALTEIDGVTERAAREIVMRALHGPDAFPAAARAVAEAAERWRPWRAYAAWHLRLNESSGKSRKTAMRAE